MDTSSREAKKMKERMREKERGGGRERQRDVKYGSINKFYYFESLQKWNKYST